MGVCYVANIVNIKLPIIETRMDENDAQMDEDLSTNEIRVVQNPKENSRKGLSFREQEWKVSPYIN